MESIQSVVGTPTGTSLEILAPYLPYSIQVECLNGFFKGDRYKLQGLDMQDEYSILTGFGDSNDVQHKPCGVLPVLRPFSQLCQLLPDGTTAAIEVAKLAFGKPHFVDYELPKISTSGDSFKISFGTREKPYVLIMPGFSCFWVDSDNEVNAPCDYIGIVDLLRSLAFALPVNGKPLIEGIDFLPLS